MAKGPSQGPWNSLKAVSWKIEIDLYAVTGLQV